MTTPNSSIPKINELVKKMLFEQHLTAVDLSHAMGWSYDSAYKLLKRSDWKISEMQAAGRVLKFNFFSLYVEMPNVEGLQNELKAEKAQNETLKQQVAMLEMEKKYLKENVELAKMKLKG